MTATLGPDPALQERGHKTQVVVPVGRHILAISPPLAAAYEASADPVIIAERVWFGRVGDRLMVHMGRRVAVDKREL